MACSSHPYSHINKIQLSSDMAEIAFSPMMQVHMGSKDKKLFAVCAHHTLESLPPSPQDTYKPSHVTKEQSSSQHRDLHTQPLLPSYLNLPCHLSEVNSNTLTRYLTPLQTEVVNDDLFFSSM